MLDLMIAYFTLDYGDALRFFVGKIRNVYRPPIVLKEMIKETRALFHCVDLTRSVWRAHVPFVQHLDC